MWMRVCVWICVHVLVCVSASPAWLSVSPFRNLYLLSSLPLSVSDCLFCVRALVLVCDLSFSVCGSACLCLPASAYLCALSAVCLFICLSACCLSVFLPSHNACSVDYLAPVHLRESIHHICIITATHAEYNFHRKIMHNVRSFCSNDGAGRRRSETLICFD